MNNYEIYSKIFVKNFSVNKAKLKNLKYQSVPKWDSVGHMALISDIEGVFNITIDVDDVIDFNSFEKGKKILGKYKIKI